MSDTKIHRVLLLSRIRSVQYFIFVLLTIAGFLSEIAMHILHDDWFYGLVPLVNLSFEGNIPTWYSSILLFSCSAILAWIALVRSAQSDAYRIHWVGLAIVFLYLSMDEAAVIHELINPALTEAYDFRGALFFSWVIPFGIFVAVFFISYLSFLRRLPMRHRLSFVASGAVYVGGALGTELGIGYWYDLHGGDNLVYGLLNVVQESLEILGATMFCSALLRYVCEQLGEIRIRLVEA